MKARLLVLFLVGMLAACTRPQAGLPPQAGDQAPAGNEQPLILSSPTTAPSATLRPSDTPLPPPTATPTLAPLAAPPEASALPDSNPPAALVDALAGWLQDARARGIPLAEAEQALQTAGWIDPGGLAAADTDGDLAQEWLVSFYIQKTDPLMWSSGDFWIVDDAGLVFRFLDPAVYAAPPQEVPSWAPGIAPHPASIQDFTGDGLADVLLQTTSCGAHTCSDTYYPLTLQDGVYRTQIRYPDKRKQWGERIRQLYSYTPEFPAALQSVSITYGENQVQDVDGDGLPELVMQGGTFGSVGAGIANLRRETWGWDGGAFTLENVEWLASEQRGHILWQANDRYDTGQLSAAKELYRLVINEPGLLSEEYPPDNAQRMARFAAFRLALVAFREADTQKLSNWLAWLRQDAPDSRYTAAAERLAALYAAGSSPEQACEQVRSFLTAGNIEAELPVEFGYANFFFTVSDVCPDGIP